MRQVLERGFERGVEFAALGPSRLSVVSRYGVAVLLIVLATLVRLLIADQADGIPYVTYFPAATLAALFGGLACGLFAAVLGAVTAVVLFFPPFDQVTLTAEALGSAAIFLVDEVIVCSAMAAVRRYYLRYIDLAIALETSHAAERRARLAAERANADKSRFLAAASHDLRQPYQAMRLLLSVLQHGTLTADKQRAVLANMDTAMTSGEDLLRSLLDISTLEAGVVVPQPAEVDLEEFIAGFAARFRPPAEAKGLRLLLRPICGRVRIDPVLTGRILDNLMTNAIRYTDAGGILLACRRVDGVVAFEVWDTGIGIAPEHQEEIFEEFYQVLNPERDRGKGVGLGLAVVRKTAELMGMRISVASVVGKGTRFRVALPRET